MLPRNRAGRSTSKQAEVAQEREHVLEESEQHKDDVHLTFEEWIDMSREILILKCNQLRLVASGFKTSLVNRLFAYFAPGHASTARTKTAPDDRQRKSSAVVVPAIPDVPQASTDILKSLASEIEKLISEKLAGIVSKPEQQTKSKRKGVTHGSRPQPRKKRGRHRSSSPTSSSDDNAGEQEAHNTSKKSRLSSSPSLQLFQPKTLSKNNPKWKGKCKHFSTSPVFSDLSSHSSSGSDSWDGPADKSQSCKHQLSSCMKPNLPPLPAPQLEKIKRCEYIDLNTLTSAHMFAPLNSTEPSYQLKSQPYQYSPLLQKRKLPTLVSGWKLGIISFLQHSIFTHTPCLRCQYISRKSVSMQVNSHFL